MAGIFADVLQAEGLSGWQVASRLRIRLHHQQDVHASQCDALSAASNLFLPLDSKPAFQPGCICSVMHGH